MKDAIKWNDPEKERPEDGDKIIVESNLGLFWGTFHTDKSGIVWVEGKSFDPIQWEDIYSWLLYPNGSRF